MTRFFSALTERRRRSARLKNVASVFSADKPTVPPVLAATACWIFVWLSAFLLQLAMRESFRINFVPGQTAAETMTASTSFDYNYTPDTALNPILLLFSSTRHPEQQARHVEAGETLVEKNEIITSSHIEKIRAHHSKLNYLCKLDALTLSLIGDGFAFLAGLLVSIGLLRLVDDKLSLKPSGIMLFFMITVPSLAVSKWLLMSPEAHRILPPLFPENLLPAALSPILASILMGRKSAVAAGFWVSFVCGIFANYSFVVFFQGFSAALLVVFISNRIRSRGKVIRIGFLSGLVCGILAVFVSLAMKHPFTIIPTHIAAGAAGGFVSALIALMLIPLYESIFGVTTDMRLIELSAMEHPLLKRLAIEAPGTYHHSLMVANLAQAGADALGDNALLATVAAYFHDIGKLTKPEFFSENIQMGDNPHDEISPHMSTLVIISHVKEGVSLALQHKLPAPIIDAIRQHHGTSLVSFFHHKASIQLEMDLYEKGKTSSVQEDDFRYPGPKPQTRETAILSLADSVEAASRSLEKITPGNIENIVKDIIEAKRNDGQLDCCALTQADISLLRKTFTFTLTNMLHGRISYPSNENSGKQQSSSASGSS